MADGKYADGSWELKIVVTDMDLLDEKGEKLNKVDIFLFVTDSLHIGGVIAKLVDALRSKYG